MAHDFTEISVRGKFKKVPSICFNGLTIIVTGRWLKTATIKDEWWLEGDIVGEPNQIIAKLKLERIGADIYNFSQKLPSMQPKYNYYSDLVSVAAIPITTFADWWENRLPQVTRKNVRRAERRGITVKRIDFSDNLIERIVKLNNSTPIRQRTRNVHFGKSFEEVKRDYSEFPENSDYLGAYHESELIGLMRLIHQGEIINIMQLFCMLQHNDKRPANALIAAALELCIEKKVKYLVYGQFIYGQNIKAPLAEFKRRNGFEQFFVPSYYVPLTINGRVAIMLNMHIGIKNMLPKPILRLAHELRRRIKEKGNDTPQRGDNE